MSKKLIASTLLTTVMASAYAAPASFNCPKPSEIQSTDFTSPSIWIAPPVANALQDTPGIGLGGKQVRELIGSEEAEVAHKPGWVCVYRSKGGMAVNDYENKILQIITANRFLRRYFDRVNTEFEKAEPYLKNYPKDVPLGFIGYQYDYNHNKK